MVASVIIQFSSFISEITAAWHHLAHDTICVALENVECRFAQVLSPFVKINCHGLQFCRKSWN
jgi:hypothetical protein